MDQAGAITTGGNGTAIAETPPLTLTAWRDEADRNPIFDALVTGEGEVSGLVAYSIYKQNKRAWLDDFIKLTGRTPTEAENSQPTSLARARSAGSRSTASSPRRRSPTRADVRRPSARPDVPTAWSRRYGPRS